MNRGLPVPSALLPLLAALALTAAQPPAQPPAPAPAKALPRPDLVLHYREFGEGEPVLVITGGPGFSGELMEPVAQMIAKKGRAILPDPRGAGGSIPEKDEAITLDATLGDFEALRQELGLRQWTVLGCSWGGMLALDYAARRPGSLKALVLLDSGGTSWASFSRAFRDNITCRMTAEERAARAFWAQDEVFARDPLRAEVERVRCILPAYFYDRARAWPLVAGLKVGKEHLNPGAYRLDEDYDRDATARLEALRRVEIPALIIHGRQDPIPESVALANQQMLKGSRLLWLEQCGHFAWLEQPEALEKALLEFLASLK